MIEFSDIFTVFSTKKPFSNEHQISFFFFWYHAMHAYRSDRNIKFKWVERHPEHFASQFLGEKSCTLLNILCSIWIVLFLIYVQNNENKGIWREKHSCTWINKLNSCSHICSQDWNTMFLLQLLFSEYKV